MRWLLVIALAACGRPTAPTCPVCAPAPAPVAQTAPTPDPMNLVRACSIVELAVFDQIRSLQLLAHDVVHASRLLQYVEKKQPRAIQEVIDATMASIMGVRPSWAFLTYPLTLAASSTSPPPLDVLTSVQDPAGGHSASLRQLGGAWTLLVSVPLSVIETGAIFVLWRPADVASSLGDFAQANITFTDKVNADVRGTRCHALDDKRMAIKVGAGYVVVEAR